MRECRSDARAIGLKPHKSVKDNYGLGNVGGLFSQTKSAS